VLQKDNVPNPNNNAPEVTEGQQPTGKLSFREYMTVGVSKCLLKDGKYPAKIIAAKFVQDEKDETKDYLRLEIQLADRIVVENRFVSGYFIFEREIKIQLGMQDKTLPVGELMSEIQNKDINIWYKTQVSTKDNRSYQNMYFSEPVEAPVAATEPPKF
jgi:hypothetical protein